MQRLYPELAEPACLIREGRVLVDGFPVRNAASLVRPGASIVIAEPRALRGEVKLRAALERFRVEAAGRVAVDVGAAAGGFARALLAAGARRVYAVDAGHGQLLGSLRQDPRVVNLEGVNLGELDRRLVPEPVEIVTIDVSYLSLAAAVPRLEGVEIAPDADAIALVKPQFELGLARPPSDLALLRKALERAAAGFEAAGWRVVETMESPTRGARGAVEFLVHAHRRSAGSRTSGHLLAPWPSRALHTRVAVKPREGGAMSQVVAVPALDVDARAAQAVVAARHLSRRYGEGDTAVDALRGVSLDVAPGRLTAVMGPSGSGKSTLMHLLAGLDRPTAGEVYIDGTDITTLGDNELTRLRRRHIGFVFQFFNLLPMLTAEENVLLPLSIAGRKPDPEWYEELIEKIGLADRRSHRPSELSGGQQQRVAIARALVSRPSVVFADEPTGNLDSQTSGEILELLRDSVDSFGQTTVMVTHDPRAAVIADRILFLADGEIVQDLGPSSARDVIAAMEEVSGR